MDEKGREAGQTDSLGQLSREEMEADERQGVCGQWQTSVHEVSR